MTLTSKMLECPTCKRGLFSVELVGGSDTDCNIYLQLRCIRCNKPQPTLHFVVDLTPQFERDGVYEVGQV